jgi:predicted NBD/HSP70 family sugar kinase
VNLKGDQATSRAINTRLLLNILLQSGPASRRALAAEARLSPGTVTALTQDLISEGLIRELEAGKSSGGRRPIPLAINFDARLTVGMKLSEDGLVGVLTDLAATEVASARRKFHNVGIAEIADHIADMVEEFMPDARSRAKKLIGVGIALPGFVDVVRGSVSSEHRILKADVPFASIISERIGLPVWIDNDVNAYAIAHRRFGLARGKQTVMAIVLGTGIGAGLVVNGKIHRGAHFRAGEIGFSPNLLSKAGAQTIGDSYTTASVTRRWQALGVNHPDIADAIAQGDPATQAFLAEIGHEIGTQIAIIAQMIDPDAVVIGGETLGFGTDFVNAIRSALQQHLLRPHGDIEFDLKDDLWGRGAAALAIDHFFDFENIAGHVGRAVDETKNLNY